MKSGLEVQMNLWIEDLIRGIGTGKVVVGREEGCKQAAGVGIPTYTSAVRASDLGLSLIE